MNNSNSITLYEVRGGSNGCGKVPSSLAPFKLFLARCSPISSIAQLHTNQQFNH